MALRKCPKCELNYLREGEKFCAVCSGKVISIVAVDEDEESAICTNCGERPVVHGEDYCAECLSEMNKTALQEHTDDTIEPEEAPPIISSIDEVSTLSVIDVPAFELPEISEEEEIEVDEEDLQDEDFDDMLDVEEDEDSTEKEIL